MNRRIFLQSVSGAIALAKVQLPRAAAAAIDRRARVARHDPVVRSFWENEIDKTSDFHKSEMLGYLVSKVGRFVENTMMRNIIGQQRSAFDFNEIMNTKKIFLVNLSKGKIGDINANLLFFLIIANSDKTTGGEKFAWILAIIFLSWFAWIFYFLLAPIKPRPRYYYYE
jgi:hypothetical protein